MTEPTPVDVTTLEGGPPAAPPRPTILPSRLAGAVAGALSGFLAVALGMLFAAIADVVSPIDAVGSEVIDRTPLGVKEWAIRNFQGNDKAVLRSGIMAILAIAAVALGVLAAKRVVVGIAGIGVFGVVGAIAAAHRPSESAGAAVPSILGALGGAALLHQLLRPRPIQVPGPSRAPLGWDRRRFLVTGGAATATALVASAVSRAIENGRVSDLRAATRAPLPSSPTLDTAGTIPADASSGADALPFVTPNADFYRVDTALSFPRIDSGSWSFTVKGMVNTPLTITYADLLAMPMVERVVTLCCVSNDVGGPYVGNAVWRGVLLHDVLAKAGVQPGAQQVFSTSIDGWSCGFPVAAVTDGRDAMIAVGMNGQTLPLEHGYPARLVVPGLYGYVSATKWLSAIELTTWDKEGYWVPRGWSQQGPVKTQSRIDVPRESDQPKAGPQKIAGVAWAQHRGIAKVEVKVDGGQWQAATLAADVSDDAWRQWSLDWNPAAGRHTIEVRATDKNGDTQTAERTDVAPNGATGHHTITVTVR
jgi:DMSO/TMAO reductase YedYZ molybdopterin-dependent catalytic subunit